MLLRLLEMLYNPYYIYDKHRQEPKGSRSNDFLAFLIIMSSESAHMRIRSRSSFNDQTGKFSGYILLLILSKNYNHDILILFDKFNLISDSVVGRDYLLIEFTCNHVRNLTLLL